MNLKKEFIAKLLANIKEARQRKPYVPTKLSTLIKKALRRRAIVGTCVNCYCHPSSNSCTRGVTLQRRDRKGFGCTLFVKKPLGRPSKNK